MSNTSEMDQSSHKVQTDVELIFGAMKREKQWKVAAAALLATAVVAVVGSTIVAAKYAPPAPVLIPYNPVSGQTYRNATVEAVNLNDQQATLRHLVYRYVVARETYNQVDNDERIEWALRMSEGKAKSALNGLWSSGNKKYPPSVYGKDGTISVDVTSITPISNQRIQVRLIKQLVNQDGGTKGTFTAVLQYEFQPTEERTLEAVWENPLGFKVTGYSITADKFGELQ